MTDTHTEAKFALAMKYRGEAAVLNAKADLLENRDPAPHYEQAAEYFRMHAEAEISSVRKAIQALGRK